MRKLNLIGQRFGRLIVTKRIAGSRKKSAKLECICDCGNATKVVTGNLQNGHTKSCGCLRNVSRVQDITGQRFGRLIVLELAGITKRGFSKWLCQCDCGRKAAVLSTYLRQKQTISCGCYHTEVIRRQRKKNRVTPENKRLRKSLKALEWRMAVYERDGFKCQCCSKVGGILNAHHILAWAKYPDKRYDIDNGVTLCKECHHKVHGWSLKAKKSG